MSRGVIGSSRDLHNRDYQLVNRIVRQHRVIFVRRRRSGRLRILPFVLSQIVNPGVGVIIELRAEHHMHFMRRIITHLPATARFWLELWFHPAPLVAMWIVGKCLARSAFAAKYEHHSLVAVPRRAT